jgi:hypothetical protein
LRVSSHFHSIKAVASVDGLRRGLLFSLLASLFINYTAIKFLIGGAKQGNAVNSSLKSVDSAIGAEKDAVETVVFVPLDSAGSSGLTKKSKEATAAAMATAVNASEPVSSSNLWMPDVSSSGSSRSTAYGADRVEKDDGNSQDSSSPATNSQFSFEGMPAMPLSVPGTTSRGLFSRSPETFTKSQAIPDAKQLARAKQIEIQSKLTQSLSKARDKWDSYGSSVECLVWINDQWNQFAVDCTPEKPFRRELVFMLADKHLFHSQTPSRDSWHCVRVGTVQSGLKCPQ